MPAKKTTLTDDERTRRIREAARKVETSNDNSDFERAFKHISRKTANHLGLIPPDYWERTF